MSLLFVRFVVRALFLSLYFSDRLDLRIEEMSRQTPANVFFPHVCYYFCLSSLSFYATSARFNEVNTHKYTFSDVRGHIIYTASNTHRDTGILSDVRWIEGGKIIDGETQAHSQSIFVVVQVCTRTLTFTAINRKQSVESKRSRNTGEEEKERKRATESMIRLLTDNFGNEFSFRLMLT